MERSGKVDQSQGADRQRLQKLAETFCEAWKNAAAVELQRFLPPPRDPFRPLALRHLVKLDLGIRWQRQQKYFLEGYLQTFPELGSPGAVGADLLFEEYCVRQLCGDQPKLSEYQRRFPVQFKDLERLLRELPAESRRPLIQFHPSLSPPRGEARSGGPGGPTPAGEPAPTQLVNVVPNLPGTQAYLPPTKPGVGAKADNPAPTQAYSAGPEAGASQPQKRPPSEAATLEPSVPKSAPLPGASSPVVSEINGYKLHKRIGSGSFAEVWQGEAPGGFPVAVKRIMRPLEDDQAQRELQALEAIRQLRHPFLLQTQQSFLADNHLYVVMELADCTLRERMKQCQKQGLPGIPLPEVLRYFRESAEALDYMHGQHLFHRDIKPQNILILGGHAKVADFGLALLQESQRNLFTASGSGTPAYMAPEVWKRKVSRHSDQYSLAFAYAEQRLGRWAFTSQDLPGLMMAHLNQDPELDPLPPIEQSILRKALAKDPDQRYPNCLAFIEELEAALADQLGRVSVLRSRPGGPGSPPGSELSSTRANSGDNTAPLAGPRAATVAAPGAVALPLPLMPKSRLNATLLAMLMLILMFGGGSLATWWYFVANRDHGGGDAGPFGLLVPDAPDAHAGDAVPVLIGVNRHQFNEPIELSLENPPPQSGAPKVTLAPGRDSIALTLLLAPDAPLGVHKVTIKAKAGDTARTKELPLTIKPCGYSLPKGFRPAEGGELVEADGKAYYQWIEVWGGDIPVRFRLIPPNKQPAEPAFYMMENKVSVALFRKFADSGLKPPLQSMEWEKLQTNSPKNPQLPVTDVVLADADRFADWLGGQRCKLPSMVQWDKAAGMYDYERSQKGPFQNDYDPNDPNQKDAIAINRKLPMPCGSASKDRSPFDIRDLAGNGQEWTGQALDDTGSPPRRLGRPPQLNSGEHVPLRGQRFELANPVLYTDLRSDRRAIWQQQATPTYAFRVVIEP